MPTDVVMPQMGESIAEGTIVRWIKNVGDTVDRDEPLFEISTDKVDAEIPSPAAGIVSEIRVKEGETVPVNHVVAVIGQAGESAAAATSTRDASTRQAPTGDEEPMAEAKAVQPPKPSPQADGTPTAAPQPARGADAHVRPPDTPAARPAAQPSAPSGTERLSSSHASPVEDVIRQRSSPLVRRIAKEHNVDISQLRGTGLAGRVTKDDILAYVGTGREELGQERQEGQAGQGAPARPAGGGTPGQVVPMSVMRKRIAEHMITSRRTSAHVHSVFEVNFGRIAQIREAKKAEYERAGVKLTYLSFIVKAAVDALRAVPVVNASIDGDNVVYHKDINIGIAVALDWGLIVPVVKNADERNLLGLSRAIADLANRARNKQLKPDEVAGGTFTITNPGVFGALFGMPIISQPQVAILGVGNVEKRPVVIDDAIAIRPMAYLTLGYDHRLIDGAVADQYMSYLKRVLENWDPTQA
jgi:pyruvate dehydrogenase E2 component (dihydrolipoamide acetyltransferase)